MDAPNPFATWDPLQSPRAQQQLVQAAKDRTRRLRNLILGLAVAALIAWFGHGLLAAVGAGVAVTAALLGRKFERGLEYALAVILLTPVFVLVLWPLGLVARLRGADPLRLRQPARPASLFVPCEPDQAGSPTEKWRPY
ncbi:MAG: hypothetical protein HY902_13425 [Deltaproteobacteria bacterium]|nr:hypothetical protein [Deltaproteobacteria bacterium]